MLAQAIDIHNEQGRSKIAALRKANWKLLVITNIISAFYSLEAVG